MFNIEYVLLEAHAFIALQLGAIVGPERTTNLGPIGLLRKDSGVSWGRLLEGQYAAFQRRGDGLTPATRFPNAWK